MFVNSFFSQLKSAVKYPQSFFNVSNNVIFNSRDFYFVLFNTFYSSLIFFIWWDIITILYSYYIIFLIAELMPFLPSSTSGSFQGHFLVGCLFFFPPVYPLLFPLSLQMFYVRYCKPLASNPASLQDLLLLLLFFIIINNFSLFIC